MHIQPTDRKPSWLRVRGNAVVLMSSFCDEIPDLLSFEMNDGRRYLHPFPNAKIFQALLTPLAKTQVFKFLLEIQYFMSFL
ncbi:hypothetical protein AVEN_175599-1 [Araneus ventricosus]|uniref:Uncharacterized protein n=1 Tax=Araneus ventricosus TaxID=182803 RepID=A0A4Y2G110_ARAVE|nr:hypothetical protein AVEN_175599-1 [Araneus ventricosus]